MGRAALDEIGRARAEKHHIDEAEGKKEEKPAAQNPLQQTPKRVRGNNRYAPLASESPSESEAAQRSQLNSPSLSPAASPVAALQGEERQAAEFAVFEVEKAMQETMASINSALATHKGAAAAKEDQQTV